MFKLNDVGMAAIRAWLACVTDGSESVGTWALAAERSANRQEGDWVFVEVELPAARSLVEQPKGLVLLRSDFVLGDLWALRLLERKRDVEANEAERGSASVESVTN